MVLNGDHDDSIVRALCCLVRKRQGLRKRRERGAAPVSLECHHPGPMSCPRYRFRAVSSGRYLRDSQAHALMPSPKGLGRVTKPLSRPVSREGLPGCGRGAGSEQRGAAQSGGLQRKHEPPQVGLQGSQLQPQAGGEGRPTSPLSQTSEEPGESGANQNATFKFKCGYFPGDYGLRQASVRRVSQVFFFFQKQVTVELAPITSKHCGRPVGEVT